MPNTNTYQYELDGELVATAHPILTGRDIHAKAGHTPVSNFVLIKIGDLSSSSIGLEEEIHLKCGEAPVLLSFNSDRVFSLLINERGYEWGDEEISATDIRRHAAIPDDHELVLDSDGDHLISDDDVVRLKHKGVERIRSRPAEKICIVVNTRQKWVEPGKITFAELIALAFPDMPQGPNTAFTVSYRKGTGDKPEGTLIEGEMVKLKKGMVFNVSATDKS